MPIYWLHRSVKHMNKQVLQPLEASKIKFMRYLFAHFQIRYEYWLSTSSESAHELSTSDKATSSCHDQDLLLSYYSMHFFKQGYFTWQCKYT